MVSSVRCRSLSTATTEAIRLKSSSPNRSAQTGWKPARRALAAAARVLAPTISSDGGEVVMKGVGEGIRLAGVAFRQLIHHCPFQIDLPGREVRSVRVLENFGVRCFATWLRPK